MTRFGYTLMTEQSGPKELVRYAVAAEKAGFDFEVSSDHYSPWLTSQGHAPYAWTVLGAVAHATERVDLATYITCPSFRHHPAVVAQKAASMQILSDGRFTLGLGSGENLNEHVIGEGCPRSIGSRHSATTSSRQSRMPSSIDPGVRLTPRVAGMRVSSGRSRSAGARTNKPRSRRRTTSSAGSEAAGL